jgi:hypothetical protein
MTTSDSDEKRPPKLLNVTPSRLKHYSIRTESNAIPCFKWHPKDMNEAEIKMSDLTKLHEQRIKTELSHSSIFK